MFVLFTAISSPLYLLMLASGLNKTASCKCDGEKWEYAIVFFIST